MGNVLKLAASAALVAVIGFSSAANAGQQLARRFVYNEASKSYFELRRDLHGSESTWRHARAAAQSHSYKGVRGRLAVVRTADAMDFVRDNFNISRMTWIGGRFVCDFRKLVWEDGSVQKRGDYSHWYYKWHLSHVVCPNVPYMSLMLMPEKQGMYWRASGSEKGFYSYLIEYPTGRP